MSGIFVQLPVLRKTAGVKLMICILEEVISNICILSVMQLTTYIINTSIFDFLENEGMIFQIGAITALKIVVWLYIKVCILILDTWQYIFRKSKLFLLM